ncbi:extracellular solute-binding protein [Paenibacillus aurantius]|uniref:Extracellular solute-binding protein n=1 Tax=Paenibacillus aurantius TaxID=2918900 RepID=A0AA96LCR4_9BACL|nr:extracellular solute-binding protein [Paenibacillus aurantius]WNQ10759.1 extracellular solute-binding protein [Paenibacillus aurantius]
MNGRKWLSASLTGALAVSVLAGCSGSGDKEKAKGDVAVKTDGMPIVPEKVNLKMVAGKAPTTAPDWNNVMLWQEYEKLTNVHVDWEMVPFDSLAEKRNIMLTGGDYPDALFTAQIPTSELAKYGSQGIFIKLNDLIDKYAPNLKALMAKYPEVRKGLTMPDGNIYSFPTIYDPEFTSVLAGGKMWIKKEWLQKLNLPEPATTEEFYQTLKAIKEKDPNGNGQPDEVGYASVGIGPLITYLKGAWGLGNRGVRHGNVDMDPSSSGKLRFIPADPKYKEMLQYVQKLYSEGLIDKDIFTVQANQFYATGAKGVYGTMVTTGPYTLMKQEGYYGLGALKGPGGDQVYSAVGSALANPGAFVITDHNKNPEATVRWMDNLYSEEGNKMFFMGFEGKSYETKNGEFEYTKEITDNPNGLTFEQALVKYVVWPGGGYPNIVRQKYFKGAESRPEAVEAASRFSKQFPKEIWPIFSYTPEEDEKRVAMETDINSYVTEMQAKFITGKASFAEWDNYIATLKKMKLDDYMKIYQAAYDRYAKEK